MTKFPLQFEREANGTFRARAACGCGWIEIGEGGEMSFTPDEDRGAIQLDAPLDPQTFTHDAEAGQ